MLAGSNTFNIAVSADINIRGKPPQQQQVAGHQLIHAKHSFYKTFEAHAFFEFFSW